MQYTHSGIVTVSSEYAWSEDGLHFVWADDVLPKGVSAGQEVVNAVPDVLGFNGRFPRVHPLWRNSLCIDIPDDAWVYPHMEGYGSKICQARHVCHVLERMHAEQGGEGNVDTVGWEWEVAIPAHLIPGLEAAIEEMHRETEVLIAWRELGGNFDDDFYGREEKATIEMPDGSYRTVNKSDLLDIVENLMKR